MPTKTKTAAVTKDTLIHDPYEWIEKQAKIKTSNDIKVPEKLIDQVIGQDTAVAVAEKAAAQSRNLLLIGDPGTGKSMIAKAMSEMLPPTKLNDILTYHNPKDPNAPKVLITEAGKAREIVAESRSRASRKKVASAIVEWTLLALLLGIGLYAFWQDPVGNILALGIMILVAAFLFTVFKQRKDPVLFAVPNILDEHDPEKESHARYVDATGSHAGALLGDVRHDPFQSGGLETPTHERVEIGAIHKAHKGILFVDEINVLRLDSQQALLTAMQDGQYSIVGQSDTSSGAMVKTEPVPCQFILVAAGNLDAVKEPDGFHTGMHPALRSRIRGYGYEVFVNSSMDDTHENRLKLCRFVAQEVKRDGRIPHMEAEGIAEIILEGQRRSGHRGKLTLRLRELGGLVRSAGDMCVARKGKVITADDVRQAKRLSRSLEQQIAEQALEARRNHEAARPGGELIGVAPGAGLVGTGEVGEPAGLVVPIVTAVSPPISLQGGHIGYGGGLEYSAKAQPGTVSTLVKKLSDNVTASDVHVQSAVPQDGVDAESCGLAIAISAISAIESAAIRQDTVLIGSIGVTGVLGAVRGVTQMVESASDQGYSVAIVPLANRNDVLLNATYKDKINVVFADNLHDALKEVLTGPKRAKILRKVKALA
ncbi:MAG: ATP-dependent protease LonB [Thermoplasmatota archaeon]